MQSKEHVGEGKSSGSITALGLGHPKMYKKYWTPERREGRSINRLKKAWEMLTAVSNYSYTN